MQCILNFSFSHPLFKARDLSSCSYPVKPLPPASYILSAFANRKTANTRTALFARTPTRALLPLVTEASWAHCV